MFPKAVSTEMNILERNLFGERKNTANKDSVLEGHV